MAMANLGRIDDIWHWPFHRFMAVRREYLRIVNPKIEEEETKATTVEIAPGITMETTQRE
jgi:hypothetical protein